MKVPDNFGGLPDEFSGFEKSKVVVLPVPYAGTCAWTTWGNSPDKGPKAIIEASKNMELYDEELDKTTAEIGIYTHSEVKAEKSPEHMAESIFNKSKEILSKDKFIVMLGGEHSVTLGLVKAYKEKYPNLSVLQLDAHADQRDEWDGTKYSHACVMARVRELGVPEVQVGIRSICDDEAVKKLPYFYAKDIYDNKKWFDKAIGQLTDDVFVTIDLDVFDPAILSATGTPEPGGLGWYLVVDFLRELAKKKKIVGFDVVELSPNGNKSCDFLAAKLIYKLIGYSFPKDI